MLKKNTDIQNNNEESSLSSFPLKSHTHFILNKYAIIQTGGKQYFALENKTIMIEKIDGEEGDEVVFDKILFKRLDENNCFLGKPFLPEVIYGKIIKQMRGPKIIVFKFKRRKKYRKKQGHRQSYTVVRIQEIK